MAGALIVTAGIAPRDHGWLDRLRHAHYPPERNRVPAHLTMFHALPPSSEAEVCGALSRLANGPPPVATIAGLMDLGGGVAFRVVSPGLDRMRDGLAILFHGLLGAQDAGGWRPHITIQNKVPAKEARALKTTLEREFRPRAIAIRGLDLHRYQGAAWESVATWGFRGR